MVGVLQDIVLTPEFENLQNNFFESRCQIFDDSEENKNEYMTYFKEYQESVERHIEEVDSRINSENERIASRISNGKV